MSKYLGLDLGDNSIGWAIIDNTTKKTINYGVQNFNNAPNQSCNKTKDMKSNTILTLNRLIAIFILFCIVNFENWQF